MALTGRTSTFSSEWCFGPAFLLIMLMIPREVVAERARFSSHTNAHVLLCKRNLLEDPRVRDITEQLSAAAELPIGRAVIATNGPEAPEAGRREGDRVP